MLKKLNKISFDADFSIVSAADLRKEDFVLVIAGEIIPGDG
jgi:high-affinity K+ transport system ATPase subunit B